MLFDHHVSPYLRKRKYKNASYLSLLIRFIVMQGSSTGDSMKVKYLYVYALIFPSDIKVCTVLTRTFSSWSQKHTVDARAEVRRWPLVECTNDSKLAYQKNKPKLERWRLSCLKMLTSIILVFFFFFWEMQIRRQATSELQVFEERWDEAVKDDRDWADPYKGIPSRKRSKRRSRRRRHSKS